MTAPSIFLYGTLRHRPLLELVAGSAALRLAPARAPGYRVESVDGGSYPALVPGGEGDAAEGLLLHAPPEPLRARLDWYEAGFGYAPRPIRVTMAAGEVAAIVYLPDHPPPTEGPWSLEAWVARWWPLTRYAADEVMSYYGELSPAEVARRYPMIRARAASRLRAEQDPTPPGPLGLPPAPLVEVKARRRVYSNFFTVEEQDLRFRRFDGTMSEVVTRAGFIAADAVTVLPYDPVRDRLAVVEQFRAGPFMRGDAHPWTLEAIAGRIDAGESAEDCARREAGEEAGLELGPLERISAYYPSPGAVSEYVISFVAICDLTERPDRVAHVGGVAAEHEDIRTLVLPFDEAMGLLAQGALRCGPLNLSLLWLAGNRARLQGRA